MYESIKRLYENGRLSEAAVKSAVAKGWITSGQAVEIISTKEA